MLRNDKGIIFEDKSCMFYVIKYKVIIYNEYVMFGFSLVNDLSSL